MRYCFALLAILIGVAGCSSSSSTGGTAKVPSSCPASLAAPSPQPTWGAKPEARLGSFERLGIKVNLDSCQPWTGRVRTDDAQLRYEPAGCLAALTFYDSVTVPAADLIGAPEPGSQALTRLRVTRDGRATTVPLSPRGYEAAARLSTIDNPPHAVGVRLTLALTHGQKGVLIQTCAYQEVGPGGYGFAVPPQERWEQRTAALLAGAIDLG